MIENAHLLNAVGIILNALGTIMLFRWGMPFRLEKGVLEEIAPDEIDPEEIAKDRIYKFIGYVGLAILVVGSVFQLIAITMGSN